MICIKCEKDIEYGVINGDQLVDMISKNADDLKITCIMPVCPVCGNTLTDNHAHKTQNDEEFNVVI